MPFPFPAQYDPSLTNVTTDSAADSPNRSIRSRRSSGASSFDGSDHASSPEADLLKGYRVSQFDCTVVTVAGAGDREPHVGGSTVQWALTNSGACTWPASTALRLVGGPAQTDPIIEVPCLSPGQTCTVDLVLPETEEAATVSYALTMEDGRLFGHLLTADFVPKRRCSTPGPSCFVAVSPMHGSLEPLRSDPRELKTLEWWLANVGQANWPDDMHLVLCRISDGLCLNADAQSMPLPPVPPSMTAHVCITLAMPPVSGRFSAEWAVRSPSFPDFSHALNVEFEVFEPSCLPTVIPAALETPQHNAERFTAIVDGCCPAELVPPQDAELLSAALLQVSKSQWSTQETCYTTLHKIFSNICLQPAEPKFRRISKTSKRMVADVLSVPGASNILIASGFEDCEDAFTLPSTVTSVEAVLCELQASAGRASMDWKRQERDARIQRERARQGKNQLVVKAKISNEMKTTLQRIKDDQELLNDMCRDPSNAVSKVDRLLDKNFSS